MCTTTSFRERLAREWLHGRGRLALPELATAALFLAALLGHLVDFPHARTAAGSLFPWFAFEAGTSFFLIFLLLSLEGFDLQRWRPLPKAGLVLGLYAVFTLGVTLAFPRIPAKGLLLLGAAILPGHVAGLVLSPHRARRQVVIHGALAFVALPLSFFAVALPASILEQAGLAEGRRLLFEQGIALLWAVFHYTLKGLLVLKADFGEE